MPRVPFSFTANSGTRGTPFSGVAGVFAASVANQTVAALAAAGVLPVSFGIYLPPATAYHIPRVHFESDDPAGALDLGLFTGALFLEPLIRIVAGDGEFGCGEDDFGILVPSGYTPYVKYTGLLSARLVSGWVQWEKV